jgi:hypothetical protein
MITENIIQYIWQIIRIQIRNDFLISETSLCPAVLSSTCMLDSSWMTGTLNSDVEQRVYF